MDIFKSPKHCPLCETSVVREGSFLYCTNIFCISRVAGTIKVWIGKLGILNWGDSLITSLTSGESPLVKDISDLYRISVEDIALHSSGMKFAQKCYKSLHASKNLSLDLVISSINIPLLGRSTALDIVNAGFDSISKIVSITLDDLLNIPNIGNKTAEVISSSLKEKRDLLISLESLLNIIGKHTGPLNGMSFCITGSTNINRKQLQNLISESGGLVKESVVSGLTFLVTNEDLSMYTSDKVTKAKKYNVSIINEDTLLGMMK